MAKTPYISVVIPARNEEDALPVLYSKLIKVLTRVGKTYEIIIIDDGSTDGTFGVCKKLHHKNKRVKVIKFRTRYTKRVGKSEALQAGFDLASGKVVITMDADLQDDPVEIPRFLKKLTAGFDLVSGWKKDRHDPLTKKVPSKLGNILARKLTGIQIHDLNCGFKAYRAEVVKSLNLYGELYKFIPILALRSDFRVGEIVVKHHKRRWGKSKFSWERNTKGLLDLLTIIFLTGYIRRPAHFFGTLGLASFGGGFAIGLYIAYLRITTGNIQFRHPLLFLGMLLMIVGIQLITTGLISEMIVSFNKDRSRPKTQEVLR